jgi:hypothetical protein
MLFKILIAVAYLFSSVNAQAYIQLSSTVTQPNAALGVGVGLTYNSIDAGPANITFTSGSSKITIVKPGPYFVIAAAQVGGTGSVGFFGRLFGSVATYTADYYVVLNGAAVANSNVRLTAPPTHKDVIVTQGVYILAAGDVIEIFGAGTNSFSEFIDKNGLEPAIPSIITTIYAI